MLNQVQIIGNIGKEPEIRTTQSGAKNASFSVAVSEKWKDKSGQQKEKTTWIPVVVWSDGLVKVIELYVKKGMRVYVQGKWDTRKWTDKNGDDRYTTELVLNGFDAKLVMLSSSEKSSGGTSSSDYDDFDAGIPF